MVPSTLTSTVSRKRARSASGGMAVIAAPCTVRSGSCADERAHGVGVPDVDGPVRDGAGQPFPEGGETVIGRMQIGGRDGVAFLGEMPDEVGHDEARRARDEDVHFAAISA